MFAIHTPRARAAFGASFQLEVGDVAPYTCIFAELGTVLAEGAHVHVALEELHEPSLPQHREGILDEVHTIQSAISLLSQREYDDLQTRAHDFVGARQIANPDGLRGRVLRTRGGGPHYRKPSDRVVIIVIPFGDVGDVCGCAESTMSRVTMMALGNFARR